MKQLIIEPSGDEFYTSHSGLALPGACIEAGRLISTGRRLILRFSRHCPVFAAFQGVYRQLVPAR